MRSPLFTLVLFFATPAAAQVSDDPLPGGAVEAEVGGRVVSLPVLKSDTIATIKGDLATVSLTQRFDNPYPHPMHARYVFPLPPDAAVYAMRMRNGDRIIEGKIREIQQAEKEFAAAKREGKQASLLKQHRANVFVQKVANLVPGEPITVEIEYAHPVPKRDDEYDFHFPMVVGPRYLPPARGADGEPEPLTIGEWTLPASAPVATGGEVDLERVSIEVHLDAGVPVKWIDSHTHVVDVVKRGPSQRTVTLVGERTVDNKDFILRYRLGGEALAGGATAFADGEINVVSLLIEPPAQATKPPVTPREMVFVLDCSGSMHGVPMEASKRFMQRALRGMRAGDYFRVVRFSHTASSFAERPVRATEETIEDALEYVEALEGMGGTEMTTGIRAALDPAPVPGTIRTVVFLTDGYIGNDVDVIRIIEQRRGDARLFSFGIGSAVNRFLLNEMARAGRGVARIVANEEDPGEAADALAKRIDAPFLTDVSVDWGEAPVRDATPTLLPDLYLGQSLRVLARYRGAGTHRVVVRGQVAGVAVSLPLDVTLPKRDDRADALPVVWARSQIEDRMQAYIHPATGEKRRERLQAEVVALGLARGLVTQWTAFVAVSRRVVNPGGKAVQRDVKVPQAEDVPKSAYPESSFEGSAAPEPHAWAAMALMLGLTLWWVRRRSARGEA